MKTSDFNYDLPEELIAQTPVEPRDHSRLLVYHRNGGQIEHIRRLSLPSVPTVHSSMSCAMVST